MTDKFKMTLIELGNRLKESRIKLNVTQQEASQNIGVSVSTLKLWERGKSDPSALQLLTISDYYKISINWLLFGDKCQESETHIQTNYMDEFTLVPRYEIAASAGHGSWHDNPENKRFVMAFRTYWIKNYIHANPKDLSVITVKGDSMDGVLNERDVILINHADRDPKEGIYVLRIDGHLLVKQVQRIPNQQLKVISSNATYESFTVNLESPPSDFDIIGKVVWFGRTL